ALLPSVSTLNEVVGWPWSGQRQVGAGVTAPPRLAVDCRLEPQLPARWHEQRRIEQRRRRRAGRRRLALRLPGKTAEDDECVFRRLGGGRGPRLRFVARAALRGE